MVILVLQHAAGTGGGTFALVVAESGTERMGVEPTTFGFGDQYTTNRATLLCLRFILN